MSDTTHSKDLHQNHVQHDVAPHSGTTILHLEQLVERVTGEFVLCHDPYCQKPVNIHQANRCVVTNAPYCDLCIEDHRDECGLCTLHLEQRREEFQARLARIPEPEASL